MPFLVDRSLMNRNSYYCRDTGVSTMVHKYIVLLHDMCDTHVWQLKYICAIITIFTEVSSLDTGLHSVNLPPGPCSSKVEWFVWVSDTCAQTMPLWKSSIARVSRKAVLASVPHVNVAVISERETLAFKQMELRFFLLESRFYLSSNFKLFFIKFFFSIIYLLFPSIYPFLMWVMIYGEYIQK